MSKNLRLRSYTVYIFNKQFIVIFFTCQHKKIARHTRKKFINDFKYIGDRLVENGLLKAEDSAKLAAKLQEVLVTPVDQKLKATMAQKLMRNALVGYFGEIPPRVIQSEVKQMEKDYAP